MQPRDYQHKGLTDIYGAFRRGVRRVLYVLETGGGKTIIFSYIARSAAQKGRRVWILVHRRELIKQTRIKLNAPHGVVCAGFAPNYTERIQICNVQTLIRRLDRVPAPDLIIVDECHHVMARTWMQILAAAPNARVLGVTATPCRNDGKGLGQYFDEMILGPSAPWLIQRGHLVQPIVYSPDVIDVTGLKRTDFTQRKLAARADKPAIIGCAIEHYRKYAHSLPAIGFCVSVAAAHHAADAFRSAGYRAVAIEGQSGADVRDNAIAGLATGQIDQVFSCDLISEGVDVPVVACGIMLRPTWSFALAKQQWGRILRAYPGKDAAIILDHAGNCVRHACLPDTPIRWTLENGAERPDSDTDRADSVRMCPKCFFVHAAAPRCPVCKFEYPKQERKVEQKKGILKRLTPDQIKAMSKSEIADEKRKLNAEIQRARTPEALRTLADELGYSDYWVENLLRTRRDAARKHEAKRMQKRAEQSLLN